MLTRGGAIWARAHELGSRRWMRWIGTGLVIGLSIAVLGGMMWYYWPTLVAYRWEIQAWPLFIGFVFYSLDTLLAVSGWRYIVTRLASPISFRAHLRIYCLTFAAGLIPGAPWHIAGRAVLYKQLGVARRIIGVAAGLEIILIIISGLWAGLLILPFLPGSTQAQLVWLLLASIPALALIHPSIIRQVLRRIGHADETVQLHYRDTIGLMALYFLVWGIGGCILYSVIRAFYPLPLTALPAIIGVWALAGTASVLAFFSPTSFGIKEVALSLLLATFVPGGLAIVIAISLRLFQTAAVFIWAAVASRL